MSALHSSFLQYSSNEVGEGKATQKRARADHRRVSRSFSSLLTRAVGYAVKYKAMEVIEYFVNEKGAKPDMKTLIALDRL